MGITEGFCADLYCDCEGCQSGEIYPQGQADFIGRNMTDISQQARELAGGSAKTGNAVMLRAIKFHEEPISDQ
jgi:hypothetical protein